MDVSFFRQSSFKVTVTAALLLALMSQFAACSGIRPAASQPDSADGLNHQPTTFSQMERLVTPGDPAVLQALKEALNQPPDTSTATSGGITYTFSEQKPSNLDLIREWVFSHCLYTTDEAAHGVLDYWQTPAETIALGTGDCEDFSILLCSLLRAYGVPADEVYVVVGWDASGAAHSWLVEKYETGIWWLYDSPNGSEAGGPMSDPTRTAGFKTSYCFNDRTGFYGEPTLPAGIYEFESASNSYPVGTGSENSYYRYLNAGQQMTAAVSWLPYTVDWPFNPNILEPWSFNVYDGNGSQVFTWSGTDTQKTLQYIPATTGIYRIEIVKRDNPERPCRLTLDPEQGWTTSGQPLPVDLLWLPQLPFPKAGSSASTWTPAYVKPPVWQDGTPRVPAPVEVPRDELEQHALDVLNAYYASVGLPPVILGSNTSARQHAEDMLEHNFASGWGTDGSTPDERYTLAGGTGFASEVSCMTAIDWQGDPSLFAGALTQAIDKAMQTMLTQDSENILMVGSGGGVYVYNFPASDAGAGISLEQSIEPYKLQTGRANFGIAYDGEHLYMVLQIESFYVNFSQPPAINDGVLSFAGEMAPGAVPYNIQISYRKPSAPLTAAQISYAYGYGDRVLVTVSYYGGKPLVLFPSWVPASSIFIDPHMVPLDVPPQSQTSFDLIDLIYAPPAYKLGQTDFNFSGLQVKGNQFSFSIDISALIDIFGKGVYTVSVGGLINLSTPAGTSGGDTYTVTVDGSTTVAIGGSYDVFVD